MDQDAAEFLMSGYSTPAQQEAIRRHGERVFVFLPIRSSSSEAVYRNLAAMRPEVVALVDGFAISDYFLNSTLGRSDGACLAWARINSFQTQARSTKPSGISQLGRPSTLTHGIPTSTAR